MSSTTTIVNKDNYATRIPSLYHVPHDRLHYNSSLGVANFQVPPHVDVVLVASKCLICSPCLGEQRTAVRLFIELIHVIVCCLCAAS
ncbi:unnamed protein product [Trichogramma brassicae]|uniref:Uncharacterized protein n=1 Tax=Trichogramma brassicae TaxID=86971 RepID=A0A6H5IEA5_9HYME|nr:unnamed protein product [Trichogramma brassicae]